MLSGMDESKRQKREQLLFYFSFGIAAIVLLFVAVIVGATIYVRWSVNQNFTFLGGNELEALTIGACALLISLVYVYRPRKKS